MKKEKERKKERKKKKKRKKKSRIQQAPLRQDHRS